MGTAMSAPTLASTRLPIQRVPGALSQRVKYPGSETGHSHPSSTKVKNAWSYTYTPPYALIAWC